MKHFPRRRNLRVYCPADPVRVEQLEVVFYPTVDGALPLPCNGCENSNGSWICQKCMAWATLYFYKNPNREVPFDPLVPDVS